MLAILIRIGTVFAWDYEHVQIGNLFYNLDTTNKMATVTYQNFFSTEDNYLGLTIANIPESVDYNYVTYNVTSIGDMAFAYCSSLASVTIPNSITSIGYGAFRSCTSLLSPVYNAHVFAYLPTSYVGAYTIPEGIKDIAGGAFSKCFLLTSIEMPNSITIVGNSAFSDCFSLTSVTIPNNVINIGDYAFISCVNMKSVTITNNVNHIGKGAFCYCSELRSIYNYAAIPQDLDYNIFGDDMMSDSFVNISRCTLYVPKESVDLYRKAYVWKDFSNIIGMDTPGTINTLPANLDGSHKLIRDGQILIIRSDKTYTVTGQGVK